MFLDHPSVSKKHAMLSLSAGGELKVQDLGSSNGTFVEGKRITGPTSLTVGMVLTFGNVCAELEQVPDDDALPAFSLQPPPIVESTDSSSQTIGRTTLASNVVERFTLQTLPEILDALDSDSGLQTVIERLGAALWNGFPLEFLAISELDRKAAPRFSAGEPTHGSEKATVTEQDDFFCLSATFKSVASARSFAPMVVLGIQLLRLAQQRKGPLNRRPSFLKPPVPDPPSVVPRVKEIYERAARIAGNRVNILLLGESGTGKEVLARFLHRAGPEEKAPFVALNCAALPKDLLEAELFGIEKGVATGVQARVGKFELADGGTLFLDEVGDMALETQAKILRVLQERSVCRLGGKEGRPVEIQVVSATNRNLDRMVEKGTFRGDLFYRLAGWEIQLPALRKRRADIPNLAAHFFRQEASRVGLYKSGISISAMKALKGYHWPGNIRELQHEIARGILLLSEGDLLEPRHLRPALTDGSARERLALEAALERAERKHIMETIEQFGGTLEDVADILCISRSTLYRRMKALGIDREI